MFSITTNGIRWRFMVRYVPGPRPLVVAAWHWLAADTDDIGKGRRCPEALLRSVAGKLAVDEKRERMPKRSRW